MNASLARCYARAQGLKIDRAKPRRVCGVALTAAVEPDSSSVAPSAKISDLFVILSSLSVGFPGGTAGFDHKKAFGMNGG